MKNKCKTPSRDLEQRRYYARLFIYLFNYYCDYGIDDDDEVNFADEIQAQRAAVT